MNMPLSRLEKYLKILEILVLYPLEFERIYQKANIEQNILMEYLNFLVSHDLIEEQHFGKERIAYAITDTGLAVFQAIQGQRVLERLKNILQEIHT